MDKLRIFNLALSVYNREPLTEEQLEDKEERKAHPEIQILEINLPVAVRKAMRAHPWSFLDAELELGEDEGPRNGYRHSYTLPKDCFRVTRADGIYEVVGNKLLTDGLPVAYGQKTEVPNTGVPEDFDDLIAYALAIFAGPKLSSGDEKAQYAATFYNSILQTMALNDAQGQRRVNEEVANGYGPYV